METSGLRLLSKFLRIVPIALLPVAAYSAPSNSPAQIQENFGKLPLRFEAGPRSGYIARGPGYRITLQQTEIQIQTGSSSAVGLRFSGSAGPASVHPLDLQPGVSHYLVGSNPADWRRNVPGYGKLAWRQLYSGVDVIFYGSQRRLEYDFNIAPNADPSQIRIQVTGAKLAIDSNGDLLLETNNGVLRHHKPKAYQQIEERQVEVAAAYRIEGDSVQFRLGSYDRSRELVIDPILSYSTYLGGAGSDSGYAIAVDSTNAAYIAGQTSTPFPTVSAAQGTPGSGVDAFVTKLNAAGNAIVYSTYIGGNGDDVATAIAVDSAGAAHITGNTLSTNFPAVAAWNGTYANNRDAFVVKLNSAGSAIVFSTYLGGGDEDRGTAIAVDSTGVYVAGNTASSNFPTASALAGSFLGAPRDAFLTKFNAAGSALIYSTYLGGNGDDSISGIAVDPTTNTAFVTGYTSSTNFPLSGAIQGTNGGSFDAFVTKFAAGGNSLVYSTYLGGASSDRATAVAIDSTGAAYVTGWTFSNNFPLAAAYDSTFGGVYDAFVSKLNPAGSALSYSTYFGGTGEDIANAIAVDSTNRATIAGYTSSSDLPVIATSSALFNGIPEGAFVTRFAPAGDTLVYSTYLGGISTDQANGIAVDTTGAAYVVGTTLSTVFPTVSAAFATLQGGTDAFVSKLTEGTAVTYTVTTNPTGLNVIVDGVTGLAPRFLAWATGSQHVINAPSPQGAGGTRSTFTSWSDGGAQSHTVTAPQSDTTYTANFQTQHQLTVNVSPAGAGTVNAAPSSGDGFYNAGTSVSISASANTGYTFLGFSGDASGVTAQNVNMSAPRNVTATFVCAYSQSGTAATAEGNGATGSFSVTAGGICPVTASSTVDWIIVTAGGGGNGSRTVSYTVLANPNATPRVGSIAVNGTGYGATFTITQAALPPGSITVTTNPAGLQVTVDGVNYTAPRAFQFAGGTTHEIGVTSPQTVGDSRYTFTSWSNGGGQSQQVVAPVTGNLTLTANFSVAHRLTTISNPLGSGTFTLNPNSADGFYPQGTQVSVTANATGGGTFNGWSGALSGTLNPQTVTLNTPLSVTASFSPLTCGSNYTLSPQHISSEAAGGTFTVTVNTAVGCFWQASLSTFFLNPWVSFIGVTSRTGTGTLEFAVQPNTAQLPRTASINVQGQVIQVVQKGVNVPQVFLDVAPSNVFFDYITLLNAFGTSNGCGSGNYCPNDVTTRGKMAELVIRSKFGEIFLYPLTPFFTDVPADHPQFKYIQKMRELGITDGCTTSTYCPGNPVTRGEMAVFFVRAKLDITSPTQFTFNATPYFTDVPINHLFFAYIQKLRDLGITLGCTTTSYCGNDPNTLGQIAVFTIRSFNTP